MNNKAQFGYVYMIFFFLSIILIWTFFLGPMFGVTASITSGNTEGLLAFVINNINIIFLFGLIISAFAFIVKRGAV